MRTYFGFDFRYIYFYHHSPFVVIQAMLVIDSSNVKLKPDQDESKVGALAKHPGVGGEHEVGGQPLKSLAPCLHSTGLTDITLKTNENKENVFLIINDGHCNTS